MTSILVAYASKHGATQGIAERIAETLSASVHDARARSVNEAGDLGAYGAFVIGGAAYMGSWLKEATEFAHRNQAILATRPVWLFSSGPLGTEATDSHGHDLLDESIPKDFIELKEAINPRDTHVFFGVLDPHKLAIPERLLRSLPAGRKLLPEGDFRNWTAINAWAQTISHELTPVMAN